jgi:hypothetical protein
VSPHPHVKLIRAGSSLHAKRKQQRKPLQGADLRALKFQLEGIDSKKSLANLYRMTTDDGHVRWICLEHYDANAFSSEKREYIRQLEAFGVKFNQQGTQALLTKIHLTSKNVDEFFDALTKGFNIVSLTIDQCSLNKNDLDKVLNIIINRSSIRCLVVIFENMEKIFEILFH